MLNHELGPTRKSIAYNKDGVLAPVVHGAVPHSFALSKFLYPRSSSAQSIRFGLAY